MPADVKDAGLAGREYNHTIKHQEAGMRARDIMEPVQETLSPSESLRDAVKKMRVARRGNGIGVKGLIVVDEDSNPVGMLSMHDILRAIMPSYLSLSELGEFTWDGMLEQMCRKVADRKVADIMSREVITVPEDAPLMECAELMVNHNLHRIPVVDSSSKVVGMIYVRDLYHAIVRALPGEEE